MLIAEVIGSVTCVIKVNSIKDAKFKVVRLLNLDGKSKGVYYIVEDAVGVGKGEEVLLAEDEISIGQMYNGKDDIPIKHCIVAKIDHINEV